MFQQPPLAWIIDRIHLTRGHSAQSPDNFMKNSRKLRRTFQPLEFSLSKRPPAIELVSHSGERQTCQALQMPKGGAKAGIEQATSRMQVERSTN